MDFMVGVGLGIIIGFGLCLVQISRGNIRKWP